MAATHRFLWLLRHAKTVTDPPDGGTDFDRVLAPRGRRDATALGDLLRADPARFGLKKDPFPQVALVSPAARTAATAELVLQHLDRAPRQVLVDGFYGAEPDDVLAHLRTMDDDLTSVMVVGHNPTAHALANGLIARADKKGRDLVTRRGFPTCALGIYRFTLDHWAGVGGGTARLMGLFTPPFDPKDRD
jgi:phosphohistidine phosphatase